MKQEKLRFNFVVNLPEPEIARFTEIDTLAVAIATEPNLLSRISSKGDLCWCLQSYLELKARHNLDVRLSSRLLAGAVNLVHSDQLLTLRGVPSQFVVCVQADYPARSWAHYHIVQNQAQLRANTTYIPLWPQPCLIPRKLQRRSVTTVAYAGEIVNGNLAGGVQGWRQRFAKEGLTFLQPPSGAWHDMSTIDVVIGVRSFSRRPYNGKPPSKMINAWHAHIPFVGGFDSAFSQIGMPGRDYLRAATLDEVMAAVASLRHNEILYAGLVENGSRKAPLFTTDAIANRWEYALAGPVTQRFRRWQAAPAFEHRRYEVALAAGLTAHHARQAIKKTLSALRSNKLDRTGTKLQ